MSKADQPLGFVVVVGKSNNNVYKEPVYSERDNVWDAFISCWPVVKDKGITYVYIPESAAKFRKTTPMACLYNAIDAYMVGLLGRKLDRADHDFFDAHPLTAREGVSQPNTLRVVHEITEPYGVCIARVRAWPGTMLGGDLKQWVNVLGMNPLAMLDRQTSNKGFCAKTGLPLDEADRKFRFEFSEEPLRPAISCGSYTQGKDGAKTAMGHASYESPRSPSLSHILQFQLTHREKINWEQEPVFGATEELDTDKSLSLYECLTPEGKAMWSKIETLKPRGSLPKAYSAGGETSMVHKPRGNFASPVKRQIRTCYLCYSETGDRVGANLCVRCWTLFTKDIACGECGHFLSTEQYTSFLSGLYRRGNDWYLSIKCGSCEEKNEIMCLPGTVANAVQKAVKGEEDAVTTDIRRTQNTR